MAIAIPATLQVDSSPASATGVRSRASAQPRDGIALYLAMAGLATVGMTGVRVAGFTISDYLFAMSGMALVVYLLSGARSRVAAPRVRQTPPAVLVGVTLVTLGGLVATFLESLDPMGSALILVRIWYLTIVWFWTIRSVSTSLGAYQRLLVATLAGATFHAGFGIFQEVSGANAGYPTWGRSVGFSDHFNDLGVSIGSLIPLMALWPRHSGGRRSVAVCLGALLVMFGGLASTGSMTQMAAALIGLLVAFGLPRALGARRRTRRRLAVPVLVVTLAVFVVQSGVVELAVFDRVGQLTASNSQERYSAESRLDMTRVAIDRAVSSPFVGVGLDEVSGTTANEFSNGALFQDNDRHQIHSIYLRILFEAGFFALLGLLLILFVVFRSGLLLLHLLRGTTLAWLPSGLLGSLVAVCLGGAFQPILYGRNLWLPAALISALWGLAKAGLLDGHLAGQRAPTT